MGKTFPAVLVNLFHAQTKNVGPCSVVLEDDFLCLELLSGTA